ncbi:hypothetical protein KFL_000980110 [Klebsormidium nitens]|uniref:Uncharacterized protein n=1 Tax=Klebsormidium nitens TaxID=105231 RepID=A0A0U9HRC1_KLENI|nr:hypothetical protein KFL_000980110 [Klebsormidium nitens]|eukprot:GAQ82024.1 hypothetical protein KFL_000980110 [Klebsormidium nitens]
METRQERTQQSGGTGIFSRTTQDLRVLRELLVRVKETQYRPNADELNVLSWLNRQILLGYVGGTFLFTLPGVLAFRFWRPQTLLRFTVSSGAASAGLAYGGSLGYPLFTRDKPTKKLLELDGSPLQGELVAILREKYPNHPALAALNARPNTSGVMYDENGERAYPRLPPAPDNGSQHEPNFGPSDRARTAQRPEGEPASGSGHKEREERGGLRKRIRADLERRRQQGGISPEGAGPVVLERQEEMSGTGRGEGMGWEREHRMARREDGGSESSRVNVPAQGRPELRRHTEVTADTFFSEPLDIAMGGDIAPLQPSVQQSDSEHHKRLSQMSRQERREYLRHRELASKSRGYFDDRSDDSTASQSVEPPQNRPGSRMHGPPPVRLGVADGFGVLGWKF